MNSDGGPSLVSQLPNSAEALVRAYYPNLATISPNGPSIVASMSGFLGIPATGVEHAAREGRLYDRFQYTEAFRGKFDYFGQVVLGLLFDHMEFLLSEQDGLPIRIANDLKITWDEISMIEGMLDREPEESSSRVMLSTTERREGHLLRRGKAIELEKGWATDTEEGAKHYVRQLLQIKKASLETFAYDALCTILQERARDVSWRMSNWFSDYIDEQAVFLYTNSFISWQKDSQGAARTVTLANEIQEFRARTTPSMMIIPRGLENFLRGAENGDQLNYDKVGVLAETRRNQDPSKITVFKGKRVHLTKKYAGTKRGQLPIEPMCEERLFGGFVQMPPMRPDHPLYDSDKYTYMTSDRSIQMMNLRTDQWETIDLRKAVDNLQIFSEDGYVYGCAPGAPNLGSTYISGRATPESPFEVRGRGGLHYAQCFGAMEQQFLSDNTFKRMHKMIKKTPGAPDRLSNLALKDWGVSFIDLSKLFSTKGNVDNEYKDADGKSAPPNLPPQTSGLKRGRDLSETITATTPLVYATLGLSAQQEQPQKYTSVSSPSPIGLADIEKVNSEKMTLLDPASAKFYSGLVKTLDDSRRLQVAQRTHGILSSSNDSLITQELLTPLRDTITSGTSGLKEEQKIQKERLLEKLSQSFTPLSSETTGTLESKSVPQSTSKTGLFTLSQVEQAENVEYLNPFTGEKLSRPEPFNMTTTRGLASVLAALGNNESLSTGKLYPAKGMVSTVKEYQDISKLDEFNEFQRRLSFCITTYNTDDLIIALNLLLARLSKSFFNFLLDYNIFFPFVPIIPRPWICVETCCVIIGTGGFRLGAMYVKDPNIMKGTDVTSKMLQWHLTLWSKAMIHDPTLVSIFDDVAMKAYRGGGTCDFVTQNQINLMSKKNWQIPLGDRRGSIFCLLGAYIEGKNYPEVINFKTKRMSNPEREMTDAPPAVFIETVNDQLFGRYLKHSPMDEHIMQTWVKKQGNNLCFQETQLLFHPVKQEFKCVIFSKNNHFGSNMYPGMMHHLRSMDHILEDQHYGDPLKYTPFFSI
jgi:hypothetical protein